MKLANKFASIFDRTNDLLATLAGVLIIMLMVVTGYEVVSRYFFGQPTIWTVEISEYALLYLTFLAAAWLLRTAGGHVVVDLVINSLTPRVQALLNTVTSVVSAIGCLAVTWFGAAVTWESFRIGYLVDTPLRTPRYIVFIIIPVGSFLLSIQFLRNSYGYLRNWRASPGREQNPPRVQKEA